MEKETELYQPVKAFLEAQGYTVKGEVGRADLVARRGNEPFVIVELKLRINLTLIHQAIDRLSLSDLVYISIPRPKGRTARRTMLENTRLCRRLGLGFMTVRHDGLVEVACDPGPYEPRKNKKAQARLLREFERLRGDPNSGGATRHGIVTGYRQDALACARYLAESGPTKGALVAKAVEVRHATTIMRTNHYGWFEKVDTGIYGLSDAGRQGLIDWADS